jgi:hypothetical protein
MSTDAPNEIPTAAATVVAAINGVETSSKPAVAAPETMQVEKAATSAEPSEDGIDDGANEEEDDVDEGAQEEEDLFTALEHCEEEKEAKEPHEQPTDVTAAPTLLKTALEKGEVKSDSEEDEAAKEEEKKVDTAADETMEGDHHAKSRVRTSDKVFTILSVEFYEKEILYRLSSLVSCRVQIASHFSCLFSFCVGKPTRLFVVQSERILQLY